ncbi:MAG: enoyl-CoA hydratase/isomerase family protein, partial [Rhizobiales bacterium]|nr:enoyl-CoA hydratase/isomerase family protein [Hyphomicrobiales bacterium]
MDNSLEISLNQKILTLTLNRPDRLNGFTETMSKSLLDQIIKASNDDTIRVIVLTGAGTIFSSGMDLDGLLADGFDAVDIYKILENLYNPLIRAMTACPKPIICGLNGIAAGGAASLVLACDIIVARRSARLVSAFSRIGLVPDCGGSWFYPHA